MAKFVLKAASIKVNNVDLSDHCSSVTIEANADEVDLTGFQETYREFGVGLRDATITATFFQDFAGSSVDATLWPFVGGTAAGGTVEIVVKGDSAATSATNPSYTMTSRIFNYTPIAGGVGDAATIDTTFRNAGTAGIVRGTA